MAYFLKIINIIALATVKYFYTPIYANMIGIDIWGTSIAMISGGIIGFLVYYHISKILLVSTRILKPLVVEVVPISFQNSFSSYKEKRRIKRKAKRKFTWKNRALVKLGRNYGMYIIIIFTPILISLILGAFLMRKYYSNRREGVPLMILSIIIEGILLVAGYWYIVGDL